MESLFDMSKTLRESNAPLALGRPLSSQAVPERGSDPTKQVDGMRASLSRGKFRFDRCSSICSRRSAPSKRDCFPRSMRSASAFTFTVGRRAGLSSALRIDCFVTLPPAPLTSSGLLAALAVPGALPAVLFLEKDSRGAFCSSTEVCAACGTGVPAWLHPLTTEPVLESVRRIGVAGASSVIDVAWRSARPGLFTFALAFFPTSRAGFPRDGCSPSNPCVGAPSSARRW